MTANLWGSRERERGCANRARARARLRERRGSLYHFKINPDLYTSWQMATESGAEITQSTASGRLRVAYAVKGSNEIAFGIKEKPPGSSRRSGENLRRYKRVWKITEEIGGLVFQTSKRYRDEFWTSRDVCDIRIVSFTRSLGIRVQKKKSK